MGFDDSLSPGLVRLFCICPEELVLWKLNVFVGRYCLLRRNSSRSEGRRRASLGGSDRGHNAWDKPIRVSVCEKDYGKCNIRTCSLHIHIKKLWSRSDSMDWDFVEALEIQGAHAGTASLSIGVFRV